MRIDYPAPGDIPSLRQLWKAAFGDSDNFLDGFFAHAFSLRRCRCAKVNGALAAALYWFDVSCRELPMAYLYAVATAPEFRGRGICRELMADTHDLLGARGYAGVLLVPETEALCRMYDKLGYRPCGTLAEFDCTADGEPVSVRALAPEDYGRLRRELLPPGGVVQEGENLRFLAHSACLYAGPGFLLAASSGESGLTGIELLGDPAAAPGILAGLNVPRGHFRTPGGEHPFAMFLPLEKGIVPPDYFGLAFD